jgi:hypothetical protein
MQVLQGFLSLIFPDVPTASATRSALPNGPTIFFLPDDIMENLMLTFFFDFAVDFDHCRLPAESDHLNVLHAVEIAETFEPDRRDIHFNRCFSILVDLFRLAAMVNPTGAMA